MVRAYTSLDHVDFVRDFTVLIMRGVFVQFVLFCSGPLI